MGPVLLAVCVATLSPVRGPTRLGLQRAPVHLTASVERSNPSLLLGPAGFSVPRAAVGLGVNSGLALAGIAKGQRALTPSGLAHAWFLGVLLWATLGSSGWALCVMYLVAGTIVTKVGKAEKESLGIAEGRGGSRGPENVWGSAAAGALCAVGSVLLPQGALTLKVGYVASLATKLSDTFASEIGKAFGKTTYLITSFKQVPRGTEGAVSLEGTLAGVAGSLIIALGGWGLLLCGPLGVVLATISAFVATNCESVIGATLQGKVPWMTNEVVNFINTLIGAVLAMGLRVALFPGM